MKIASFSGGYWQNKVACGPVVGQFAVQPARLHVQAGRPHHKAGEIGPLPVALYDECGSE